MSWFQKKNEGGQQHHRSKGSWNAGANEQQQQRQQQPYGRDGDGNIYNSASIVEVSLVGEGNKNANGSDNGSGGSVSVSHTLPSQDDMEVTTGCFPTKMNNKKKKKNNRNRNIRERHDEDQNHEDQEKHHEKKKRALYSLFCLLCLLTIVGVFLFFWFLTRRNNDSRDRDGAPQDNIFEEQLNGEDLSRLQQLRDILSDVLLSESSGSNTDGLYDSTTPQYDALVWVAIDDPLRLDFDTTTTSIIQERYGIALLYFAFSGINWWKQHNFLSAYNVCEWNDNEDGDNFEGIKCSDSSVTEIHLDMNHLEGIIPIELPTFLPNIRFVGLGSNSIYGTIPKEISNWHDSLEWLNLGSNELTGEIPIELASLTNLKSLIIYGNKLDGEIPNELGTNLVNLDTLYLEGNDFITLNLDEIFCEPRPVDNPGFEHFYADCGNSGGGGVTCSCCTHCCDGNGADCLETIPGEPDEV